MTFSTPGGWGTSLWDVTIAGVAGVGGEMTHRDLAPRNVVEILDESLDTLVRRPRQVLAAAAVTALPVGILAGMATARDVVGFGDALSAYDPTTQPGLGVSFGGGVLTFAAALTGSVLYGITAWMTTTMIMAELWGRPWSVGGALRGALRNLWRILGAWFMVHVLEALGFLGMGLGAPALMVMYAVTVPAMAVEDLGPTDAMRRSWRLNRGSFWRMVGLQLALALVIQALGVILDLGPLLIVGLIPDSLLVYFTVVTGALSSLVKTAVTAALPVLIYLDLRVRREGLDLDLELERRLAVSASSDPRR